MFQFRRQQKFLLITYKVICDKKRTLFKGTVVDMRATISIILAQMFPKIEWTNFDETLR